MIINIFIIFNFINVKIIKHSSCKRDKSEDMTIAIASKNKDSMYSNLAKFSFKLNKKVRKI